MKPPTTRAREGDSEAEPEPLFSPEGVDLTLIRWMLSLVPLERLQVLQETLRSIERLRGEAAED
jgi:hypothetical protein